MGQSLNEVSRAGLDRCRLDRRKVVQPVQIAVADVLAGRELEPHVVLEDSGHAAAPLGRLDVVDVHAVDGESPRRWAVQPQQELGHGRLASAVPPHKSHTLAGTELQIDSAEYWHLASRIREAYPFESHDRRLCGRYCFFCPLVLSLLHLHVEVVQQIDHIAETHIHLDGVGQDQRELRLEPLDRGYEGREVAHGEPALYDERRDARDHHSDRKVLSEV